MDEHSPEEETLTRGHDYWMAMALDEARKAYEELEVPVGAVLVGDDGRVLAQAHNASVHLCDPTAHAEILALRQGARVHGNYRLPGTTLYVTLEPCPMCYGAMIHARVQTLVFGASDPRAGAVGSAVDLTKAPVFNHYVCVIPGVRAVECAELLRRFFQERR